MFLKSHKKRQRNCEEKGPKQKDVYYGVRKWETDSRNDKKNSHNRKRTRSCRKWHFRAMKSKPMIWRTIYIYCINIWLCIYMRVCKHIWYYLYIYIYYIRAYIRSVQSFCVIYVYVYITFLLCWDILVKWCRDHRVCRHHCYSHGFIQQIVGAFGGKNKYHQNKGNHCQIWPKYPVCTFAPKQTEREVLTSEEE